MRENDSRGILQNGGPVDFPGMGQRGRRGAKGDEGTSHREIFPVERDHPHGLLGGVFIDSAAQVGDYFGRVVEHGRLRAELDNRVINLGFMDEHGG